MSGFSARRVLDVVLPERCIVCGRFGAALHPECAGEFPQADGVRCPRCWAPSERGKLGMLCARCAERSDEGSVALDELRARFRFSGHARWAILEAKFRGVTSLLESLAGSLVEAVPAQWQPDAVVPIPLSGARRRRRGFNQSEVVARRVATELGVPFRPELLARVRRTAAQASLDAERRRENVSGAFEGRGASGLRVLVVDDVTTTGSTLEEAGRALRAAGATHVFGVAIARED